MKKIPFKWKLFLIFSYTQLLFWGVIGSMIIYNAYEFHVANGRRYTPRGYFFYLSLFALGVLLVMLNNFLNIYAVHRYFPETPVSARNKMLMKIAGVLAAILWVLLLVFFISVTPESLHDRIGISVLSIFLFILLISLYTLI